MIKNVITDLFYFCLILIYWLIAICILLPILYLDRLIGTRIFNYLDIQIRKISN